MRLGKTIIRSQVFPHVLKWSHTMRKIPKFSKTELCFVKKLSSENENRGLFAICSNWSKNNSNKFFGFVCMNYGNSEPRLKNTIFYIYRSRNKKDILENNKSLISFMENNGFYELKESARDVDTILDLVK
jgi:hypothetical protein